MGAKGGIERRQFERYAVADNVFLTFRPNFDRVGRIKDISQGGTAFEYVTYDTRYHSPNVEVDIFSQFKDFTGQRSHAKSCTMSSLKNTPASMALKPAVAG